MNTNHGNYDVGVFFTSNYICTGSFYDSFEYFHALRKRFKTCLIIMLNEPEDEIFKAIKDKYDVDLDALRKDILVVPKIDTRIMKIRTNVLFSPSMSAITQMFVRSILIPHRKIIVSQEIPYEHPDFQAVFQTEDKWNVLMLYDDRVFKPVEGYKNRIYRQTINFDIFKSLHYPVDDACLINVCTDHKCYTRQELANHMRVLFPKKWFVYTKSKWYDYYKILEHWGHDNNIEVKVELAPIDNFMNRFDKMLYLPSLRQLDPSPRLLAECEYFGKRVIYHDFGKIEDGGYWRWRDVLENFDGLKMTENDEIFDIIGEYI